MSPFPNNPSTCQHPEQFVLNIGTRNADGKPINYCKLCGTTTNGGEWPKHEAEQPKRKTTRRKK